MPSRRAVDLVVISDVHLGTRSCKAEQLLLYLNSINPKELVLNGDIVDFREFRRKNWLPSHTDVMKAFMDFASAGVPVHYLTGNHDRTLRCFAPFCGGPVRVVDAIERDLGGKRTWILHGDVVEEGMTIPGFVRRWACRGYRLCRAFDRLAWRIGSRRVHLARSIKQMRAARQHIDRYEQACAEYAAKKGFDAIVTGHIHYANLRRIGAVDYINSGDWVESMTALEYDQGQWRVVQPALDLRRPNRNTSMAPAMKPPMCAM